MNPLLAIGAAALVSFVTVTAFVAFLLAYLGPIGGPSRDACLAAHPGAVCRLVWTAVP